MTCEVMQTLCILTSALSSALVLLGSAGNTVSVAPALQKPDLDTCSVPSGSKQDCGYMGVDANSCQARGCCWQPLSPGSGEPWCYYPSQPSHKPSTCSVPLESKQDCGYKGVDANGCQASGCCWQPLWPGSREPWCYYPSSTSSPTLAPRPSTPGSPDDMLLSDFQSDTGVAFTKLTHSTWQNGPGHGGFMIEDAAVFFKSWNGNPMRHQTQQAMTISNSKKWIWPFHGAHFGYSSWGLLFSLREEDEFWKYFSTSGACTRLGAPLMAQCGDCRATCCGQQSGSGLVGDSLSFAEWTWRKNAIVQQSGDPRVCPPISNAGTGHENPGKHGWNEFSTNGLSYDALVGVLSDLTGEGGNQAPIGETGPNEQDVCNFFTQINQQRESPRNTPWPIFNYQVQDSSATLKLGGYLDCSAGHQSSVATIVHI